MEDILQIYLNNLSKIYFVCSKKKRINDFVGCFIKKRKLKKIVAHSEAFYRNVV